MADMKQIHDFAVKWCDKFRDQNIKYIEGRVWFSGYNFGNAGERYEKVRSKNFKIEKASADKLLNAFAAYFGNEYVEIFATDIGD